MTQKMVYGAAKPPEKLEFTLQISEIQGQFGAEIAKLSDCSACVHTSFSCVFDCSLRAMGSSTTWFMLF